jgi:hypothetical protein
MKKLFILISALLLILVFASCGTAPVQAEPAEQASLSPSEPPEEASPSPSPVISETPDSVETRAFTEDDFMTSLDTTLESAGFEKIASTASPGKSGTTEEGAPYVSTSYEFGIGGFIYIYNDESSGNVIQVAAVMDIASMTEELSNEYAVIMGYILGFIDLEKGMEVMESLDITNLTDITSTEAAGDFATYSYTNTGTGAFFVAELN